MTKPLTGISANRPVVGVSWFEAKAYASWKGCDLPTEAQWERAARGSGKQNARYPWGKKQPDEFTMNCEKSGLGHPSPVGIFPDDVTEEGIFDLSGNVREWCVDWYDRYPGNNDKNDAYGTTYRVVRGGSWGGNSRCCRVSNRNWWGPGGRYNGVGFRLAASAR